MSFIRLFFTILALLAWGSGSAGAQQLPLGDGKVAAAPQPGYIYSCQLQFNGGGAFRDGNWIQGNVWDPDLKIHVQGEVPWSDAAVAVAVENGLRVIRANGLPEHATGQFPVARDDPAWQYDRNPNSIRSYTVELRLPLDPEPAAQPTCLSMGAIGYALSGAAIFNGLDAGGRDAMAHELQDRCNGHPQPEGQYHYHGYSPCMTETGAGADGHSGLVGYALDGFGIYGLRGEHGRETTDADLDACHGHTHTILWDGKPRVMYHYHLTREYPYSLGCFKGTPITLGQSRPQPGPWLMIAAARQLGVDPNLLLQAMGPPPGDFARAAQMLNIPEERLRAAFRSAQGR